MSYPECDQYECDECPRRSDCVDYEPSEAPDGTVPVDSAVIDRLLDERLSEIEDRLAQLEREVDGFERMISAVIKTRNEEE